MIISIVAPPPGRQELIKIDPLLDLVASMRRGVKEFENLIIVRKGKHSLERGENMLRLQNSMLGGAPNRHRQRMLDLQRRRAAPAEIEREQMAYAAYRKRLEADGTYGYQMVRQGERFGIMQVAFDRQLEQLGLAIEEIDLTAYKIAGLKFRGARGWWPIAGTPTAPGGHPEESDFEKFLRALLGDLDNGEQAGDQAAAIEAGWYCPRGWRKPPGRKYGGGDSDGDGMGFEPPGGFHE